jgi:serine/threonine protein kinase
MSEPNAAVRAQAAALRADQMERWQRGERVPVEEYLTRQAELATDDETVLDLIYSEVCLREQLGESPRLDEYVQRFPRFEAGLRRQFAVHQALASGAWPMAEAPTLGVAEAPDPDEPRGLPTVPGYEILGQLGQGGMGIVYRARHLGLQRVVALKMILAGAHAGEHDLARFLAEAQAVAQLQHPNIVQLHESGQYQGLPYFTLELMHGGSLAEKLKAAPLKPQEAARLVEQLAHGAHRAHQQGIVHRDLKPQNVLLAEDGTPKITDFGLAKRVATSSGLTATGAVMGTPSYMAPEQVNGGKDVGPAADIYALGAVLYECLTGRPPFQAPTALDTMMQVVAQEPIAPRRLVPRLPGDLETICLKCLQKGPSQRYASAGALAEDLRRFQCQEPILARPPSLRRRALQWSRRRPAVAALLAVLGIVVLGSLSGLTALWLQADRQRVLAESAGQEAEQQRQAAEAARKHVEEALTESRKRLALNYLAYGRACVLASRLANSRSWAEAEPLREEFGRYYQWLRDFGDPALWPKLDGFKEAIGPWKDGPAPANLKRRSLELAHACRESWLLLIAKEFPDIADQVRAQLYARACRAADALAKAATWQAAGAARQEFWELYWGELAIVESTEVEAAMKGLGDALGSWPPDTPPPAKLQGLARELRTVCDRELKRS